MRCALCGEEIDVDGGVDWRGGRICDFCDCMPDYDDEDCDEECPTCRGRGTVNPLTADYFCVSTEPCRDCDGKGTW
jgi:DnaJ-class molecular chaperone